jgi:hypothetical protein
MSHNLGSGAGFDIRTFDSALSEALYEGFRE